MRAQCTQTTQNDICSRTNHQRGRYILNDTYNVPGRLLAIIKKPEMYFTLGKLLHYPNAHMKNIEKSVDSFTGFVSIEDNPLFKHRKILQNTLSILN